MTRYTDNLKLCSSYIHATATASTQFTGPPQHCHIKPLGLTYAAVVVPKTSTTSGISAVMTTITSTISTQQPVETAPPFDYQAKIKRIMHEVETKLKAKLEAVIANLQALVDNLEQ